MRGDESAIGIKNVTDQRAAVPGAFSRQSGVSRRADDRGHGADRGRALHLSQSKVERGAEGVLPHHRQGQVPQAGRARRHDRISHEQDRAAKEHVVVSRRGQSGRHSSSPRPKSARCFQLMTELCHAIDPTARIEAGAVWAQDVEIGPYCVIGPRCHDRRRLPARSPMSTSPATPPSGRAPRSIPFASLGAPPQSVQLSRRADPACHRRRLRHPRKRHDEHRHRGRRRHHRGRRRLLPDGRRHVGHDCHVGNNVVFANNAMLGGHVSVGDNVVSRRHAPCASSCASARAR